MNENDCTCGMGIGECICRPAPSPSAALSTGPAPCAHCGLPWGDGTGHAVTARRCDPPSAAHADERESIGNCESCNAPIYEGEPHNYDEDGIIWHRDDQPCPPIPLVTTLIQPSADHAALLADLQHALDHAHGEGHDTVAFGDLFVERIMAALRAATADAGTDYERGVRDVLRIRCIGHRDVPQMNVGADGSECGACIAQRAHNSAESMFSEGFRRGAVTKALAASPSPDLLDLVAKSAAAKNDAYAQRNRLVAALSKVFPAHECRHPDSDTEWEDDWRSIVCIHLPTGQATWHIHDSERPLFTHLAMGENHWDGHDDAEKWRRVAALAASPSPGAVEADLLEYAWGIICNAGGGDWTRESAEWQTAAAKFREQYHAWLDSAARRGAAGGQDG